MKSWPPFVDIQPVSRPPAGVVTIPGSKSITNRALPISAFATGISVLTNCLESQDSQVMLECLYRLGVTVHQQADRCNVHGCAGQVPNRQASLFLENSGTSMRFLTAMLAAIGGEYELDGIARMRERPLADLIDALIQLGVNVTCKLSPGCPPIAIDSTGFHRSEVSIAAQVSSQFLSGLLMAVPLAKSPLTIRTATKLVSEPYVTMTLAVMKSFGVTIRSNEPGVYQYDPATDGSYSACEYTIEPDASAASYFFAAAAITGGSVTVAHLGQDSLQGDLHFVDVLERMGCTVERLPTQTNVVGPADGRLRGIDVDMADISDTVQTLAAVACFADGPTTIRNVEHIRFKETDRIDAVANELRKLGVTVHTKCDGLTIVPGPLKSAEIATYNDHRMAMSFSLIGLRQPGIRILDPKCVEKTFPNYFETLADYLGA